MKEAGRGDTDRLVSVVVPVFEGERFLADAIESVLAQDHRPIEVIVVDDGSTDGSAAAASSFEDVLLVRTDRRGPAAARNAGWSRARGAFVAFLDADDVMAAGRLSAQLAYLDAHPGTGCVLTQEEVFVEPSEGQTLARGRAENLVRPAVNSMLVRRDALLHAGGLDPSFGWTEWMDLLFRLRDAGVRVELMNEVGQRRRVHDENRSRRVDALRDGLARAIRGHLVRQRTGGGT